MGAGILPTAIHKNKLYFLFGKENQYEKSAPGFSDFGGGTDGQESFMQTAIREGGEELTGFLGMDGEIKKLLKKHGTYNIDLENARPYRVHIFPIEYDHLLPYYYNNNQRFLQKHLDPSVIKSTKIFEKEEIRWICVDDLPKMRKEFRHYFQEIVGQMVDQKKEIRAFIEKSKRKTRKRLF